MVTTSAGHAKKISGAELDDDDGDNHGMYLEDLFGDGTNHGLSSLEDVQARAIEQALMQCANPSGALAKACIESILNPPPPFESSDDDEANTDQTLPVPTAVKAVMAEDIRRQAEDIRRQQYPHTFLAELDKEMRNKNKSYTIAP